MRPSAFKLGCVLLLTAPMWFSTARSDTDPGTVLLPAGDYVPAFARQNKRPAAAFAPRPAIAVEAFRLDRYPVTNGEFLAFVKDHPDWRKSRVKTLFADNHYLDRWRSDVEWGEGQSARQPVTNVSWFAAQAYCIAAGGDLPTTDQWEYALADGGRRQAEMKAAALAWYGEPNPKTLPAVGASAANGYGVNDLVGLVWEWTQDFQNAKAGADLRNGGDKNGGEFCGGASFGAKDPSDYVAFMRYAFRASLKASYTTENLGFRCARPAP